MISEPVQYYSLSQIIRPVVSNPDHVLMPSYDLTMTDELGEQGAAAFWFLHRPAQKQIAVQLALPKAEGNDPLSVGHESMARAASQVSAESMFPHSIRVKKAADCTSLFLALWLPLSRLEGGAHHAAPMYPESMLEGSGMFARHCYTVPRLPWAGTYLGILSQYVGLCI